MSVSNRTHTNKLSALRKYQINKYSNQRIQVKTLLHPTYFPDILTFATIIQKETIWEVEDNYQKQTYRNRCYICTDQGRHLLSIPIRHVGGKEGRQKCKDVKLDNSYPWQRQHWRTLETVYRTSPYFEYYEDEIESLFKNEQKFLLDFNLKTIETICNCLQIEMPTERTSNYEIDSFDAVDMRLLVNAKKKIKFDQIGYNQVFGDRHDFVENTSILDLLFNEGPNSVSYLKAQNLSFLDA